VQSAGVYLFSGDHPPFTSDPDVISLRWIAPNHQLRESGPCIRHGHGAVVQWRGDTFTPTVINIFQLQLFQIPVAYLRFRTRWDQASSQPSRCRNGHCDRWRRCSGKAAGKETI
jgi:hypothetical protein